MCRQCVCKSWETRDEGRGQRCSRWVLQWRPKRKEVWEPRQALEKGGHPRKHFTCADPGIPDLEKAERESNQRRGHRDQEFRVDEIHHCCNVILLLLLLITLEFL